MNHLPDFNAGSRFKLIYKVFIVLIVLSFSAIPLTVNAQLQNFDLAFRDIHSASNQSCDVMRMDVDIVNWDNPSWEVKSLSIYIHYDNNITIDEEETYNYLNANLFNYYEGFDGNDMIDFSESEYIIIRARAVDNNVMASIFDLRDLVTIFFTALPSTDVTFTFSYDDPKSRIVVINPDLDLDCQVCYPKEESNNSTYSITENYIFSDPINNYDLAFSDVLEYVEPNTNCGNIFKVDVKMVNQDLPYFGIECFNLYINYSSNTVINKSLTKASLNNEIKARYKGYWPNDIVNINNGIISIKGVIKSGATKLTLEEIDEIITIYFNGNPGELVSFDFSYTNPTSLIKMIETGVDDCVSGYPKMEDNNPNYSITKEHSIDGLKFKVTVSTLSNTKMKGMCDGYLVEGMEDVNISYYNNDYLYCESLTDEKGETDVCQLSFDCISRIEPEKEICKECGLDPVDILRIREVILGSSGSFDYAYQTFVADVSGNGVVTTLDIVLIQKVLLGIPTSADIGFKFIPQEVFESFEDGNVYGLGVPSYMPYIELEAPLPNYISFYGFKSGDVVKKDLINGSSNNGVLECDHCAPTCYGPIVDGGKGEHCENANLKDEIIEVNTSENKESIFLTGSILAKDSFDLLGFSVLIEPLGLEIDTVILYDHDDEIPGYHYDKTTGILKVLWLNKNSYTQNISENNDIFTIIFDKQGMVKSDIKLVKVDGDKLNIGIMNDNSIHTTSIGNSIDLRENSQEEEFYISPTLFENNIRINYYSQNNGQGNIVFYDMHGKVLASRNFDVYKGMNMEIVNELQNIPVGVILYRVNISEKVFAGKIIKVDK